jgi:hypothetical protein
MTDSQRRFVEVISPVMGLFYVVWFPMLARDLFRLGRGPSKEEL